MKGEIQSITILLKDPCSQNWDLMSGSGSGKFCDLCSKNLYDFSGLSDNQLAEAIARNSGEICGRVSADQLNRPLKLDQGSKNRHTYSRFISAILLFFSGYSVKAGDLNTEVSPVKYSFFSQSSKDELVLAERELPPDSALKVISGYIYDSLSKKPIEFCHVYLFPDSMVSVTDLNGYFRFEVTGKEIDSADYILITYLGERVQKMELSTIEKKVDTIYYIEKPVRMLLGGLSIEVERKKWWQIWK